MIFPKELKQEWIELLEIPAHLQLVHTAEEIRNKEKVKIFRFQKEEPYKLGIPHITFIISAKDGHLLSYVNRMLPLPNQKIGEQKALEKAEDILKKINKSYFIDLSFIRIDKLPRLFINAQGEGEKHMIYWVKFSHSNGSYNWVGLSTDGSVENYEIESRWDYFRMRRKTEMWDHDGWVKARLGQGPELERPNALARD